MRSFRKKHRKGWVSLLVLVAVSLAAAGAVAAGTVVKKTNPSLVAVAQTLRASASASCENSSGKFCWNGVNGADACPAGTTGNMLWIFNPHSDAVPQSLTITWANGDTVTYTGWTESGGGQNWHLTVNIDGSFGSSDNPNPVSAYVTYTGALGNNPVLTISGCNESSGGTTGTTTTGTTQTTTTGTTTGTTSTTGTTETTTTGSTTTVTVPSTTTVTTPSTTTVTTPTTTTLTVPTTTTETTTTTVTTPKPPKHHHKHHKPKIPKHPHPTNTE